MADPLNCSRLLAIAEDIDHFKRWWQHPENIDTTAIRHGSATLRRLLVEDVAGTAWRQLGQLRTPKLQAPDLLAFYEKFHVDINLVAVAAAAGVRYGGLDTAFLGGRRVDNPTTGVPATADEGFAVAVSTVARRAATVQPSELDALIERVWFLPDYLAAPGLIRRGQVLTRREVIKHMANEMGGVHIAKSTSAVRELLVEAEQKLIIQTKLGEIRGHYIEVFAIGQAVGRATDFDLLSKLIRGHCR